MARVEVTCDSCHATLKLKDVSALGRKVRCPKCGETFTAGTADADQDNDEPSFDADEFSIPAASAPVPRRSRQRQPAAFVGSENRTRKPGSRRLSHGRTTRRWLYSAAGGAAIVLLTLGIFVFLPSGKKLNSDGGKENAEPVPNAAALTVKQGRMPDPLQIPDWLIADAPFDVKSFWVTVPETDNSAALYLDALYEFLPQVEVFFPQDVRAERTPVVQKRGARSLALQIAWFTPNAPKDTAERDAVIDEHAAGFEKLERAQERPQCCFEYGLDATTMIRITVPAREVVRVVGLEIERDLNSGRLDHACQRVAQCLRLSRDMRVRAPGVLQGMASGLDAAILESVRLQLHSSSITAEFCDQLLAILVEHEAIKKRHDPFLTSLRADYVRSRLLVHEVLEKTGEFAEGKWPTAYGGRYDTLAEAALVTALGDMNFIRDGAREFLKQQGEIPQVIAIFQQSGHAQLEREDAFLADWLRQFESRRDDPFQARLQGEQDLLKKVVGALSSIPPDEVPAKFGSGEVAFPIAVSFVAQSELNNGPLHTDIQEPTRRSGFRALVALRKWQLQHRDPPQSLADLFPGVPREQLPWDHYAREPLRIATFSAATIVPRGPSQANVPAGGTLIYSVGPDGVDDQARRLVWGAANDEKGDLAFAMGSVLQ